MYKKNCAFCSKPFLSGRISPKRERYCSLKCGNNSKLFGIKLNTTCNGCGKSMLVYKHRFDSGRGRNCSKECQFKSQERKILKKCAICEKDLILQKSRSKNKRHYCSKPCRLEGMRRFDSKRIIDTIKQRKRIDKLLLGKRGKSISYDGYYWFSNKKIHRHIMEQHIGRKLLPTEIVHHINGDKLDNRIENLQIVSRSEHNKIHGFLKKKSVV